MKKKIYLLIVILSIFTKNSFSQSIRVSTYLGGSDYETPIVSKKINNEIHILGGTQSTDYPVTNGTTLVNFFEGPTDMVYTKLDINGNILFSTYLGGGGAEDPIDMEIIGNEVHIIGTSTSTDYPVTNGSSNGITKTYKRDIVYTKLDATNGNILFSTYLGGFNSDEYARDLEVSNGEVFIIGRTGQSQFITTNGTGNSGSSDLIYIKLDSNGNTLFSTYLGGNSVDEPQIRNTIKVIDGEAYIFSASQSTNFPVTNGGTSSGSSDITITKYDSNNNMVFSSYIGGSGNDEITTLEERNGLIYLGGITNDSGTDFPVTNGSLYGGGDEEIILMTFDTDGSMPMATFIGGNNDEDIKVIEIYNNEIHLGVRSHSSDYPTTDGSTLGEIAYTRLDENGNITFSTRFGGSDISVSSSLVIDNNQVHILGFTRSDDYPVTNGTSYSALYDMVYTKLDYDGKILLSSYIGVGISSDIAQNLFVENGYLDIVGYSFSNDYAVTNSSSYAGSYDFVYTRLETCPTPFTADNIVTPSTQLVCQNALVEQIVGGDVAVLGDDLVPIYRNGVESTQLSVEAEYQWQTATSPTGPWTDIGGAIEKNYSPSPIIADKYFRRVAKTSPCCGSTEIAISDVSSVIVDATVSPTVEGGGIFNTCPGTAVTIGGSPTATGGSGSYTYEWAEGNSEIITSTDANPAVTPVSEGAIIYTVTVTDANGCIQIDQAIVNAYQADAGEATVSYCEGSSGVQLGSTPIAGLAGVTYSWSPNTDLSCSDCAQPIATPSTNTTYTLTLTIPITGGGTCQTTDDVTVLTVSEPSFEFAGSDVVICLGETATLGTTGVAGYSYTWAPGNYLTQNNTAQTTFQPGNLKMPSPNPITYYATAEKDGCTFVDQIEVAVIEANTGVDGCGPRTIGLGDRTPNINETYTWTKVSGPGNFTGATDEPIVPVSASIGGTTIYQLEVSYNGTTCTDQVIVPDCGCVAVIGVNAPSGCPNFDLNGGNVKLIANAGSIFSSDPSTFTYAWSPALGLSGTTGQEVFLTDNVERTYTVTITSPLDPSFSCNASISVNNPAWSLPTFTTPDATICAGTSIEIGASNVTGYTYEWTGETLSSYVVSNPTAIAVATTDYIVTVTDDLSGCTTIDTSTITVANPNADAGPDHLVCDNGVITIGTAAEPNTTYLWSPGLSNWQNGTDSTSAEPDVLVAINTTFTVTATHTPSGCTSTDQVDVIVSSLPTPFVLPNLSYCPSDLSDLTLGVGAPVGVGYTYSWSPATLVADPTAMTTTVNNPKPSVPTTFTLVVRNAEGCEQIGTQTIEPTNTSFTAGNNQTICKGETTTLGSSSNPTTGITYTWSPATGLDNVSSPNPTFAPSVAGTYTFTLTMDEGGCLSTKEVTITVNDFTLPAMPSVTVCEGSCVQIGTTPEFGTQYFWSPTDGLSDPNIANPTACVSNTTIYTLTAIGLNGCSATAQVTVGTNPEEAPTVNIEDVETCLGATGITFSPSVSPTGNYSYTWSPNDGSLSDIYAANPEVYIQSLGAKTYTLTIVDTNTGCSTFAEVNLNVVFCELPVELASFSGRFTDCNTVQLDWTTASELNNDYFEVQHSNNGRTFNTLDIINGAGVSSENIRYQFKHLDVQSRLNYYRLKQVDFSGESEYSEIITIENNCRRFSFSDVNIYPNPVQGNIVNLELESINNQVLDITIFNLVGELVKTIPLEIGNGKIINEIDISELKSGVYFFNISNRKEQERQTYKIIKID